jgi:hypothetical protein
MPIIQDNLWDKKVLAPSKNPWKWPIMCFARIKITSDTFRIIGYINSYNVYWKAPTVQYNTICVFSVVNLF